MEIFDDVLVQADAADKKIKDGTATTLTGIPLAIKDNILIKGRVASSASRILENYTASYDAHVIEKLKDSGAVFIGRTNMDEFAMGGSTENSAYGPTKNPHDESRVAGVHQEVLPPPLRPTWHSAPLVPIPAGLSDSRHRSAALWD